MSIVNVGAEEVLSNLYRIGGCAFPQIVSNNEKVKGIRLRFITPDTTDKDFIFAL